jgi:hypothetical protein
MNRAGARHGVARDAKGADWKDRKGRCQPVRQMINRDVKHDAPALFPL